jgi:hypothetical protein
VLGLGVFVGFVVGLPWIVEEFRLTWLEDVVANVGAIVGAALGFVAWLGPHLQFINHKLRPLLDAYGRVVTEEKLAEAEREAEAAVIEQQLRELSGEQAEQQRIVAEQESVRADLEALATGEQPGELLARFIEDRARGEGYRRHLGLVSYIRRDFEVMSNLMRPKQTKEKDATEARPLILREDDLEIDCEKTTGLPPIERIVLCIDDLDRCRHEQVVDVLEAIHLLLAFDLFVVVVGVDERWLRQSLLQAYPDQLATKDDGSEPRASPADYLGKIFQIPIWLRPLSFGENGNYSDLLGELVGDEVVIIKDESEEPAPVLQPEPAERRDACGGSSKLTPVDIVMPTHREPSEETRDRVCSGPQLRDTAWLIHAAAGSGASCAALMAAGVW